MDAHAGSPDVQIISSSFAIPASEIGRALPHRAVTRETISDEYVLFVLFCNPAFPDDSDTVALKDVFSTPPSSNRKTFDIYEIFLLIKQMHDGEIKTWNQLALTLGVEPAAADEVGGAQRVQQYNVRLKKWMKVTHIDAFFQYLAGKPHDYYMEVPPLDDPHPSEGRDGVPLNEDLALRALDPRLRPKRGRKRLESSNEDLPPAQRNTFAHPAADDRRAFFATPMSAFPHSAFPQSAASDRLGHDPWSAISPWPSQLGMSATEPKSAFSAFSADPRVDIIKTPIMANRLNKWAGNAVPNTPLSRAGGSVSPSQQRRPTPPMRTHSNLATTAALTTLNTAVSIPVPPPEAPMSAVSAASTQSRKERQRLQLQVPKHVGGPVRLMTPPAPVPVDDSEMSAIVDSEVSVQVIDEEPSPAKADIKAAFETLKRQLASDLLRAETTGRKPKLTGSEAKALAAATLGRIGLADPDKCGAEAVVSAAIQLGLAHVIPLLGMSFPVTSTGKTVSVTRFMVDDEGYEMSVEDADISNGTTEGCTTKNVFELRWTTRTGALVGDFSISGIELGAGGQTPAGLGIGNAVS